MNKKLTTYALELVELDNDPAGLDLFEWEIEEEWLQRAHTIDSYFSETPADRLHWAGLELQELRWLESFFLQREDYEKCARLLALQTSWRSKFGL
jgi:hypothetical protein